MFDLVDKQLRLLHVEYIDLYMIHSPMAAPLQAAVWAAIHELVAAGRDPDDALVAWMRNFSIATGVPFMYKQHLGDTQLQCFGPDAFREEFAATIVGPGARP